ncbi:MAG: DUF1467 family protein [Novosphingobium sp.]
MKLTSIIAIYALFWVMSAFLVSPFGVRTHDEVGEEMVPGQADSAPVDFRFRTVAWRATIVSVLIFGLYYANYVNGWVTAQDLNIFGEPPNYDGSRG